MASVDHSASAPLRKVAESIHGVDAPIGWILLLIRMVVSRQLLNLGGRGRCNFSTDEGFSMLAQKCAQKSGHRPN